MATQEDIGTMEGGDDGGLCWADPSVRSGGYVCEQRDWPAELADARREIARLRKGKPTREEIREILRLHAQWLRNEPGRRADLIDANLIDADLIDANLHGADLHGANLSDADLRDACLSDANLSDANLSRANLSRANLSRANMCGADLHRANLHGADLRDACLRGADLRDACLSDANLVDADLRNADLRGTDLCGADLVDGKWSIDPPCGVVGRWWAFAWSPNRVQIGCTTLSPAEWLGPLGEQLRERERVLPWEADGLRAIVLAARDGKGWVPAEGER